MNLHKKTLNIFFILLLAAGIKTKTQQEFVNQSAKSDSKIIQVEIEDHHSLEKTKRLVNNGQARLLSGNSQDSQSKQIDNQKNKNEKNGRRKQSTAINFIRTSIYTILAISGLYIGFFGFRFSRPLMVVVSFYVSYYSILLIASKLLIYNSSDTSHQLRLLAGSVTLGFAISMLCFCLDKINFLVLGLGSATAVTLFLAEFVFNIATKEGGISLLMVYLASALLSILLAYKLSDHFIILGSALTGSIVAAINIGVVFQYLPAFEDTGSPANAGWIYMWYYLSACVFATLAGTGTQYLLRKNMLKLTEDNNMGIIRRTSFLN